MSILLRGIFPTGQTRFQAISDAPDPFDTTLMLLRGDGANDSTNIVYLDSSTNEFAMTNVGASFATLQQTSFTPFNTEFNDYNPGTMGGSMYVNGNSNLTYSGTTFGAGAFTVEFWFNSGNLTGTRIPIDSTVNNALVIRTVGNNTIEVNKRGQPVRAFSVPTMSLNTWYHVAIVKNADNQATVFLNGVRSTTGAVELTDDYTAATNSIGGSTASSTLRFIGFLSNLRIVTGSAVYDPTTSSITVPTAPVTAIAGTQLLLNFTNGGCIDSSSRNLVGLDANARISTAQSKFGVSSIYTDGVGDRVVVPTTTGSPLAAQTGDFTYETWVYFNAIPSTGFQNIFGQGAAGQTTYGMLLATNGRVNVNRANVGNIITSATTISTGVWYHLALVRTGNEAKLYVNGVKEGVTYTAASSGDSLSFNGNPFTIGLNSNAYFDDFRISNVARYTENFTPPGAL
jgi:hypothetical protein